MEKEIVDCLKDIRFSNSWVTVEPVSKGWSRDKKYYIEDSSGQRFLLRLSDSGTYEKKRKEYEMMKEVCKLGITMSIPVDFGQCDDGKCAYSLLTWIDGVSAEEVVQTLSKAEQYKLGIDSGRILKKFHSISAPEGIENWESRMVRKFGTHLERYKACGINVQNDELALQYIKDNLYLLKDRPQAYQHGDFHLGNLIATPQNTIGVIDFNRWDWGDPFEEFYKMMLFSREVSIPFAKGQIDGYFENRIPDNFFNLLALYVADVILFSVVWAIPFGTREICGMIKRAEMILSDYDNFNTTLPKWFVM